MSAQATQGVGTQLLHKMLMGQQPQFDLNRAVDQQGQQNDLQTRRLLNSFGHQGKPIRRRDMRGNIIDDVAGQPTGLDAFYANNPNVLRGQFDPTGAFAQGRTNTQNNITDLGFARDHAIAEAELSLAQAFRDQVGPQAQPEPEVPFVGPPVEAMGFVPPVNLQPQIDQQADELSRMAGIVEALLGEIQAQPQPATAVVPPVVPPVPELVNPGVPTPAQIPTPTPARGPARTTLDEVMMHMGMAAAMGPAAPVYLTDQLIRSFF